MADEILTKQPTESRRYNIDFAPLLATGDAVDAVTSVTGSPSGLTIGSAAISSPLIQVRISAGTGGVLYQITAIVTTTGSDTLETEARLRVEEV